MSITVHKFYHYALRPMVCVLGWGWRISLHEFYNFLVFLDLAIVLYYLRCYV
jgi:hypothetical protein